MKKILTAILVVLLGLNINYVHAQSPGLLYPTGNPIRLNPVVSSWGFNTSGCYAVNNVCLTSGGGGGSSNPFTPVAGGNATSTLLYLYNGAFVLGSTTIQFASSTSLTTSGSTYLATSNGSVGIGTTSPNGTLAVQSNSSNIFVIATSSATGSRPYVFLVDNNNAVHVDGTLYFNHPDVSGGTVANISSNTSGQLILANANGSVSIAGSNVRFNAAGAGFYGVNNAQVFGVRSDSGGTGDYVSVANTNAGGLATLGTDGASTNINLDIAPKGTGNVGIGTTTPAQTLSIQGNTLTSGNLSAANIMATGTATIGGNVTSTSGSYFTSGNYYINSNAYMGGSSGAITLNAAGSNQNITLIPSGTGNTLISTGNLGIGTTTPLNVLTAVGTIQATNALTVDALTSGSANASLFLDGYLTGTKNQTEIRTNFNGGMAVLPNANDPTVTIGATSPGNGNTLGVVGKAAIGATFYSTAAPSNGLIVQGNVGAGSSSPATALVVGNGVGSNIGAGGIQPTATYQGLIVTPNSANAQMTAGTTNGTQGGLLIVGGSNVYMGAWSNNPLIFRTNNTDRMTLDTSGNVGVGTSSPSNTLTINGSSLFTGVETNYGLLTLPNLTATSTASSTFTGGIDAARVCLAGTTTCLGSTGGGSGTVTSVATNNGLTGGTITTTGTLGLDLTKEVSNSLQWWNGSQLAATGTPSLTVGYLIATTTSTSTYTGSIYSPCFSSDNSTCLSTSIGNATAYKQASNYATTAALAANVYNNGTSGVGATLTEVGTGTLTVDGASPSIGQRILVQNEATGANNGIYTVTATGSGIAAYVLTRSTDFNSTADVFPGVATYIISGTANVGDTFVLTSAAPITIGSTALTFAELAAKPGSVSSAPIVTITGTSSINFAYNAGGTTYTVSTSTPVNVGEELSVSASCGMQSSHPGDEMLALNIGNPGGGTTTRATAIAQLSTNTIQYALIGEPYYSTTTGMARVEIDQLVGTNAYGPQSCTNPSINIIRVH